MSLVDRCDDCLELVTRCRCDRDKLNWDSFSIRAFRERQANVILAACADVADRAAGNAAGRIRALRETRRLNSNQRNRHG